MSPGKSLRKALRVKRPLLLPAVHDGLTARLAEAAGFRAAQVGGFAAVGARHGEPDIDLHHLDDRLAALALVTGATGLPVVLDCDDGYGDAKNVTHAVERAARAGAAGLFIEDQRPPKRCGQIGVKEVVARDEAVRKLRAADRARRGTDLFLIGRTDALAARGLAEAVARAREFAEAGCDAVYVEGPRDDAELREVGEALRGLTLCTTMMEGGGKTPWHPPGELYSMGYRMLFYPTTVLFRVAAAAREALVGLREGLPMEGGMTLDEFESLVGLPRWAEVEKSE